MSTTASQQPPQNSTADAAVTARYGVVQGNVLRDPGRDPRSGSGAITGPSVPVGAAPVQARTETGDEAAHTVTAADGSFQFQLPPGTYLIVEEITGVSQEVTITEHTTTTATLYIHAA